MERERDLQLWTEGGGEDDSFIRLFNQIRMSKNIDKSDLCRGICSGGMLTRFEQEDRPLKKLLRDCFFSRLGIYANRYEKLLNGEEYLEWKQRMDIVSAISENRIETAEKLLEKYYAELSEKKNKSPKSLGSGCLETQFYYGMEALVRMRKGCDERSIFESLDRAVKVTVPKVESIPLKKYLLSVQELNLILERVRYGKREQEERLSGYMEIIHYICGSLYDDWGKVQIYPKTVFYYVTEYLSGMEKERSGDIIAELVCYNDLLKLSNGAVELVRNTGLAYYFYELLEVRDTLCQKILYLLSKPAQDGYSGLYSQNKEWLDTLKWLYDYAGVSCHMAGYEYLYVENDVYYIGDVISSRRELYGLSRKEASAGVCSINTLMRIEREKINVQRQIREEILARMKLPRENYHGDVISEDYRTVLLARRVADYGRFGMREARQDALDQLEFELDMNNSLNRQFVERQRLNLFYDQGKIDREEYLDAMRRVLEYTVPFEEVIDGGNCYLTNEELLCIYNMSDHSTNEDQPKYIQCLQGICRGYEAQSEQGAQVQLKKYSTLLRYISSYLGNVGKYEESDEISRKLVKLCMENRRLRDADADIYNPIWNEIQHVKEGGEPPEDFSTKRKTYLKHCITICEICKDKPLVEFYEGKLQD